MLKAILEKAVKLFKTPEPVPEITDLEDTSEVIDGAQAITKRQKDSMPFI